MLENCEKAYVKAILKKTHTKKKRKKKGKLSTLKGRSKIKE
jgi:hypothetical protein